MIDEEKTFEKFGYYSTDWAPKSHKKVVVVYNKCGKERIVLKFSCRKLCKSCSLMGKKHPHRGKKHTEKNKTKNKYKKIWKK